MKIAILSTKKQLYSTQRLVEAAQARGHHAEVINTLRCNMNVNAANPTVYYNGKTLANYDAVIPRIGTSETFYGTAVVRQFEMMGVFCLNDSVAITRSRDKLRALQLISKKNIGLPITGFAHSLDDTQALINMAGGVPLVVKFLEGTQGIGVVLVESIQAARSIIEAFLCLKVNIMVQEYIKEANGCDIRCLVVGDRVVAAMQRRSPAGEFRANLHRGGSASTIELTAEESKVAVRVAHILGLNVAGVDIVRSNRGPLIMEVNSTPGLQGIENISKVDVAGAIIHFIEENVSTEKNM